MPDAVVSLTAGPIVVDVDPAAGGRIAQITVGATPLLIGRSEAHGSALAWGWYPMVPWAGRIRNGRFEFDGRRHQLPRNHGDHAMHGVGFASVWSPVEATDRRLRIRLDLPSDDRWPFGGRVVQTFVVEPDRIQCAMAVTAGAHAFPVSFGWHPWFRKPERLDFSPSLMYRRDDDHIALGELVPVPPGPWDDCFVNDEPVRLTVEGIDLEFSSPCSTWVVFDEPVHATCVEPQTGPPDAFHLGAIVLQPGATATAFCQLTVTSQPWARGDRPGVTGR